MLTDDALLTQVGEVAFGEFQNASETYHDKLRAYAERLPTLTDDELGQECESAIYDRALVNSFRGNWEHEHFKASACFSEAECRAMASGHVRYCPSPTIYGRAHARVMRQHGHTPSPEGTCTCGKEG
jgi:hypothetical protein